MVDAALDAPTRPERDATLPVGRAGMVIAIGDGRLVTRVIDRDELVIGRDPGCDFAIDHPSLSRRHVRLLVGPPLAIQDLGSTNGTRVADELRRGGAAVALGEQAAFQIGPIAFIVLRHGQTARHSLSGRELLRVDDPTPGGVPAMVADFARTTMPVLITGETGTGKEVLATTVHALSGRSGPLVAINCAALSESLLESELFGHERGAFTGAVAHRAGLLESAAGGTVFLDEVGELSPVTQAKLLRAVERREVLRLGSARPVAIDIRFVAATHRDLQQAVAAGTFREDLYFRLDGVTLLVPPLRERRAHIASLAARFLEGCGGEVARHGLSAEVLAALSAHAWPGNVRELKMVIERAAVLARGGPIAIRHLVWRAPAGSAPPATTAPSAPAAPAPAASSSAAVPADDERTRILAALAACAGNQTRAAERLGISRSTLVARLRHYDIPRPNRSRDGGD